MSKLVRKWENILCGPASNIALMGGDAEYAIYVCSKEGFVAHHGWERPLIDYMCEHPDVAMAGNLCHLPRHVLGREYQGYKLFNRFRMQAFARENPDRVFTHVQGGAFIIRRDVLQRAGGFNPDVPQDGMDVEMSYFLESKGYSLGNIPEVESISTKTRPTLTAVVDERTVIAHPLTAVTVGPALDQAASGDTFRCNICGHESERGPDAAVGEPSGIACAGCGSEPFGRAVYRLLAADHRTHRKLPALALTDDRALSQEMDKLFAAGGIRDTASGMIEALSRASGAATCIVADTQLIAAEDEENFWRQAVFGMAVGGELVFSDVEWTDPACLPDAGATERRPLANACKSHGGRFQLTYVDMPSRLFDTGRLRLGRLERVA